jgi:hypothetical protein
VGGIEAWREIAIFNQKSVPFIVCSVIAIFFHEKKNVPA